ncbi:hypothetical protein [Streptomyces hydrogenans]|uniref:hypothetical protein n=1 Tax=Streptomyces hydrogenans TaxID=1873719 RepID=UPI0033A4949B
MSPPPRPSRPPASPAGRPARVRWFRTGSCGEPLVAAAAGGAVRVTAGPAPRPARVACVRRLLALLCGALLFLGAFGGAAGPAGAEPRAAAAPAAPDPVGETHEPGSAEAGLPGRARHRRTRIRPATVPARPRRSGRAARAGAPVPVPAPRPSSHRRVVMRC